MPQAATSNPKAAARLCSNFKPPRVWAAVDHTVNKATNIGVETEGQSKTRP